MVPAMMVSINASEFFAETNVKPAQDEEAHDNRDEYQVTHKCFCNVRERFNRLTRGAGHMPVADLNRNSCCRRVAFSARQRFRSLSEFWMANGGVNN